MITAAPESWCINISSADYPGMPLPKWLSLKWQIRSWLRRLQPTLRVLHRQTIAEIQRL